MTEKSAITGLGITEMGKVYGRTAAEFAADAVVLAAQDAGLDLHDIDGLLISSGVQQGVSLSLARDLGLRNLTYLSEVQAYGSTAGGMVAMASMAVQSGLATTVACVFADAPLVQGGSAGAAYGAGRRTFRPAPAARPSPSLFPAEQSTRRALLRHAATRQTQSRLGPRSRRDPQNVLPTSESDCSARN
ncbi:MAG: thiolase family protein [Pseudonocardiales bacterium]|nr:thiolase family protein [Pseudonocardiales bacterium]